MNSGQLCGRSLGTETLTYWRGVFSNPKICLFGLSIIFCQSFESKADKGRALKSCVYLERDICIYTGKFSLSGVSLCVAEGGRGCQSLKTLMVEKAGLELCSQPQPWFPCLALSPPSSFPAGSPVEFQEGSPLRASPSDSISGFGRKQHCCVN